MEVSSVVISSRILRRTSWFHPSNDRMHLSNKVGVYRDNFAILEIVATRSLETLLPNYGPTRRENSEFNQLIHIHFFWSCSFARDLPECTLAYHLIQSIRSFPLIIFYLMRYSLSDNDC